MPCIPCLAAQPLQIHHFYQLSPEESVSADGDSNRSCSSEQWWQQNGEKQQAGFPSVTKTRLHSIAFYFSLPDQQEDQVVKNEKAVEPHFPPFLFSLRSSVWCHSLMFAQFCWDKLDGRAWWNYLCAPATQICFSRIGRSKWQEAINLKKRRHVGRGPLDCWGTLPPSLPTWLLP